MIGKIAAKTWDTSVGKVNKHFLLCALCFGMPHAICRTSMPYAVYRMPYAVCRMPYAVCRIPYAGCRTLVKLHLIRRKAGSYRIPYNWDMRPPTAKACEREETGGQ